MLTPPDLSSRPYRLTVERAMEAAPATLFDAWTKHLDQWFAAPGTLAMRPEIDAPFFFETHFDSQRHPHYGRFLRLVPDELVEMTWVTGNPGTRGFETVVTLKLVVREPGATAQLEHAGFADEESMKGHEEAWPHVLALLDERSIELT